MDGKEKLIKFMKDVLGKVLTKQPNLPRVAPREEDQQSHSFQKYLLRKVKTKLSKVTLRKWIKNKLTFPTS